MSGTQASPAFADERQERIAEFVSVRGRARIGELASQFAVTEQTIRKDLRVLHDRGLIKRTHGGALALHGLVDRDLAGRRGTNQDAKERIALACLELMSDGDSAFFDSGTTVAAVAAALAAEHRSPNPRLKNLSILTSSLDVAQELADIPGIEHVLLGGQLRTQGGAVGGGLALENLERFTVEIAFIGASGFSADGLSVATVSEAQLKAAAVERARHVVVPIDATKAGATDFARICQLDEVDTVVMDAASEEIADLCASHAIRLVVAGQH